MSMTRIKICGLTRAQDVDAAVEAGADAVGLVFYPESARFVSLAQATELARRVPPFVTIVGLFVNASPETVRATLAALPIHLLQFHGDEDDAFCRQFGRPFLKAVRVRPEIDMPRQLAAFPSAQAILLDAFVEGYGGGGKTFDWTLVPDVLPKPVVLSGGLDAENVGDAIRRVRPLAVDVSSGVESGKGIKDVAKIRAFVKAVRHADAG